MMGAVHTLAVCVQMYHSTLCFNNYTLILPEDKILLKHNRYTKHNAARPNELIAGRSVLLYLYCLLCLKNLLLWSRNEHRQIFFLKLFQVRDTWIFKGGYHWRKIGEGHTFLILVQGKVIQFYLSPMEGHTIVSL